MEKTLVLFTVSPTGLGHIRVMDAIKDGLYPGVIHETVGLQNVNASKIHSLGSRIPFLIKTTEFSQNNPLAERIVTSLYVNYLMGRKKEVLESVSKVAQAHPDVKFWVVISTHYALAYSILSARADIRNKFGVDILLCVVVTDDSPQRVWAVKGADIIFVPSEETRQGLIKLGVDERHVKTVSFPVSPRLSQKLSDEEFQRVVLQLTPGSNAQLQIEIPVSGAAVQLPYLERIIKTLSQDFFQFTVVGLSSPYTESFFEKISKFPRVQTSIGTTNAQTVALYESLFYQSVRPAVEITKPSEQTFKAILSPRERGGVILLLTSAVGRQEKNNLDFLIRHKLMPDPAQEKKLEDFLINGKALNEEEKANIHYAASHWRAIKLPENPDKSAVFIKKLREEGIFSSMLSYIPEPRSELTSNGVKMIWDEINQQIENYDNPIK